MWFLFLPLIGVSFLQAIMAPRHNVRYVDATPGQIGEKDIPMASHDAPIPVLFGTRVLSQPNVVWWGDVVVIPIRRSSSSGGKKG